MAALGVTAPALAATPPDLNECPVLAEGYRGGCVNELQTELNEIDSAGLAVDGYFGPATKVAVENFQLAHREPTVDGVVGRSTKEALWRELSVATPKPSGRPGDDAKTGGSGEHADEPRNAGELGRDAAEQKQQEVDEETFPMPGRLVDPEVPEVPEIPVIELP